LGISPGVGLLDHMADLCLDFKEASIFFPEWLKQWEGDQEIFKSSGKGESTWVVTHVCMEAMVGISLYSYLYVN
jgi:hypothetical protein